MRSNRGTAGTLAVGLVLVVALAGCGNLGPAGAALGSGEPGIPAAASPLAVPPAPTPSVQVTTAAPTPSPPATGPQPTVDPSGLAAIDELLHDIDSALASEGAASAEEGSDK